MVVQIADNRVRDKISPNFIYNRMDFFTGNNILLHVKNGKNDSYLFVHIIGVYAELGIWMMDVSSDTLKEISVFIFKNVPRIEYIIFFNAISDKFYVKSNHFHVELPKTFADLENRISSKHRYNIRRCKNKVEQVFGEVKMLEYVDSDISDYLIQAYFEMKKLTHHINYNMSSKEYVEKYHVSNVYVLYFGERMAAIILTCEQCPIVYLENLTYDMEFSKYSPGMMAYDMVLERLIEKGKSAIYLGGGDYDYKKRYNSIETIVTDGKIYRSLSIKIKYKLIDYYNKHLFWKIKVLKEKCSFFYHMSRKLR